MTFLPYLLFLLGLLLIVFYKPIARAWYKMQIPWYKRIFGNLIDFDSNWFRNLYFVAVVLAGVFILIGGCALLFGPIYI